MSAIEPRSCPECKTGYLVKRSGVKGDFWGCSNYQGKGVKGGCNHSEDYVEDTPSPSLSSSSFSEKGALEPFRCPMHLSISDRSTFESLNPTPPELTIDGKGITFLEASLRDRCRFYGSDDLKSDLWLIFFEGSPQEKVVRVIREPEGSNWKKQTIKARGTFFWTIALKEFNKRPASIQSEYYARVRQVAKECLYGNREKEPDFTLNDRNHPDFALNRKDFVVLNSQKGHFYRTLILFALGLAYQDVYIKFSSEMTNEAHSWASKKTSKTPKKLIDLRNDVIAFSAGSYWHFPLKAENEALVKVWQKLTNNWRLHDTHLEIKEQLSELESLVSIHHEKRVQVLLWVGGVIVSAIGMLNIFFEPQEVRGGITAALSWLGF